MTPPDKPAWEDPSKVIHEKLELWLSRDHLEEPTTIDLANRIDWLARQLIESLRTKGGGA